MHSRLPLLILLALTLPPEAAAQRPVVGPPLRSFDPEAAPPRSQTQGPFLRAHLSGIGLSVDGGHAEIGAGLGVKAGYGLSRLLTLYVGIDAASMESGDYSYALVDAGAQFNFGAATRALVPYLEAALSGQFALVDVYGSYAAMAGGGLTLGGGVKYFLSPVLALDAGLLATPGAFRQVSYRSEHVGIDHSTAGARVTLGLLWFPPR